MFRDSQRVCVSPLRVQVHANCRIRRIYFTDRVYTPDEMPPEFKLFIQEAPPVLSEQAAAVSIKK